MPQFWHSGIGVHGFYYGIMPGTAFGQAVIPGKCNAMALVIWCSNPIALFMGENDSNDLKYRGFLTPKTRKYLIGEFDLDNHSNPSQFKTRLNKRIEGAALDLALLEQSDRISDEQLKKIISIDGRTSFPGDYPREDQTKVLKNGGVGYAKMLAGDSINDIYGVMSEAAQTEDAEARRVKKHIISQVVSMFDILDEYGEDDALRWLQTYWPTKAEAIEIAASEIR